MTQGPYRTKTLSKDKPRLRICKHWVKTKIEEKTIPTDFIYPVFRVQKRRWFIWFYWETYRTFRNYNDALECATDIIIKEKHSKIPKPKTKPKIPLDEILWVESELE